MLKNHEKELMVSINLFLDNILKINNLFKTLLQKYFDQKFDDVQNEWLSKYCLLGSIIA